MVPKWKVCLTKVRPYPNITVRCSFSLSYFTNSSFLYMFIVFSYPLLLFPYLDYMKYCIFDKYS